MTNTPWLLGGVLLAGLAVGYLARKFFAGTSADALEQKRKLLAEKAETDAKVVLLEAKDKAVAIVEEAKREEKDRQQQIARAEERLPYR